MKKKKISKPEAWKFVAQIGLEPIQTEPESGVLPLHHWAMSNDLQK